MFRQSPANDIAAIKFEPVFPTPFQELYIFLYDAVTCHKVIKADRVPASPRLASPRGIRFLKFREFREWASKFNNPKQYKRFSLLKSLG